MASATAPPHCLLVVDDESMIRAMLSSYFTSLGYQCESHAEAATAIARVAKGGVDAVISDMHMPGAHSGLELLRELRRMQPGIVFFMITGAPDHQTAVAAMRSGANDFITKPIDLRHLADSLAEALKRQAEHAEATRTRRELEQLLAERTEQLGSALRQAREATDETLRALAMALDMKARDVAGHSMRVSRYGVELARQLGYSPQELARIEHASYLHDIGKLAIPDAILNKPGALTEDEREVMRGHVRIGFELVNQVQSLSSAAELVLTHQEHFDGGGYPRGLAGNDIPRDARIFAVADALDAMTSDRPYRQALSWGEARSEIMRQSGRQFDPSVVEAFLAIPTERWQELEMGTQMPLAAAC